MDQLRKKEYIRQFVAQGVEFDQAVKLVYCTDAEIVDLEADEAFQAELQALRVEVALRAFSAYTAILSTDAARPADLLKRLQVLFPEAFRPQTLDNARPLDLNLTIVKQRGTGAAE